MMPASSQERPKVAIVVPVLNRSRTLRALLDALQATDWDDLHVFAVDCGSADGSLELLQARARAWPELHVVALPGAGRATALAEGCRRAGTRDVVRLHGDVVPDAPDWLRRLHDVVVQEPDCGIVGAKIVLPGGRIQSCGRRLINGLGIAAEWSDLRWLEEDRDEDGPAREVDGVSGECCYLRRAVLERTGGIDTNYDPVYGDDDDFCLMARWHGYRVLVAPAVRIVHHSARRSTTTGDHGDRSGLVDALLRDREQLREAHRDYFHGKWGFDPNAPDLHEIRRRYGHTRICWQIGTRLVDALPARPAVDVCLVTWNSMHVLPRMLQHLAASRWEEIEIFVTDNGSTDGTTAYLESLNGNYRYPVHVTALEHNIGVAPALNMAFARGIAPLVARLDDDTIVAPDWLERLVPRFHQRPYAGVVGPRVLHDDDTAALQGGPRREWPRDYRIGVADADRAGGLIRSTQLRGCCNLYRRSVFAVAGWLDPRFAPSQFDEYDHHVACCVAGYEVLYDGDTAVRHTLSAGRGSTRASFHNTQANRWKCDGKWRPGYLEVLERGIDFSIDGRFLPPDGDTQALWERQPRAPEDPPRPVPRDSAEMRVLAAIARQSSLLRTRGGPLEPFTRSLTALGWRALVEGDHALADAVATIVRDLLADDAEALSFLACYMHANGSGTLAERIQRAALRLDPDQARRIPGPWVPLATEGPAVLVPLGQGARKPRVLLLPPWERHAESELVERTAAALQRAGAHVTIETCLVPDARGADVVHAFGIDDVPNLLSRLQGAKASAPSARIVLTAWQDVPLGGDFAAAPEYRAAAARLCDLLLARTPDEAEALQRTLDLPCLPAVLGDPPRETEAAAALSQHAAALLALYGHGAATRMQETRQHDLVS